MDVSFLAEIFDIVIQTCYKQDEIDASKFTFKLGYFWEAGLKCTRAEFEKIQEADLILISVSAIKCGKSGCIA